MRGGRVRCIAVRTAKRGWTYRDLRDQAVHSAHRLRCRLGFCEDTPLGRVAMLLDKPPSCLRSQRVMGSTPPGLRLAQMGMATRGLCVGAGFEPLTQKIPVRRRKQVHFDQQQLPGAEIRWGRREEARSRPF